MSPKPNSAFASTRFIALAGGAIWVLLLFSPLSVRGDMASIARLLMLAVLVLTPLALSLAATPEPSGRHPVSFRAARVIQPGAAALVAVSFFLPTGPVAAALASVWLAFAAAAALFGLVRLRARGLARIEEVTIDAGLMYLPVGGAWLVLSRLGVAPLGFDEKIVLLTAVHFHYAAFITPVLVGMAGRALAGARRLARAGFKLASVGVIASPALVAAGMTFSPALEVAAALVMAASLMIYSVLVIAVIVPGKGPLGQRALLALSAAAPPVTMLFSSAYALGEFAGLQVLGIARMIHFHGWPNALALALGGLMAWSLAPPESRVAPRDDEARRSLDDPIDTAR